MIHCSNNKKSMMYIPVSGEAVGITGRVRVLTNICSSHECHIKTFNLRYSGDFIPEGLHLVYVNFIIFNQKSTQLLPKKVLLRGT